MDRVSVCRRVSNLAASSPCHNATLFDLYFSHSASSLCKPTTTAAVGDSFVDGQHRSTAVPTVATHESSWVNRGVQIVKKIETKLNRDRIVDRKIESKSIEIDKAES